MKEYFVTLTTAEREQLAGMIAAGMIAAGMIAAGKAAAKTLAHARIRLEADPAAGTPAWADGAIAGAVEVSTDTVERVRRRFVEDGLGAALVRKRQDEPSRGRVLDGAAAARPPAVARSPPPGERKAWTPRMPADELVESAAVESISAEAVRRATKNTPSSRTRRSGGACRRAARAGSPWPGWRTSWRCTTGRTTSGRRRRASTRCRSNG